MNRKIFRIFLKIAIIAIWASIFYLQFERPYIAHIAHHISPSLLLSSLPHFLFWTAWISFPLIIFAIFKGRYFCRNICPIGLAQDIIPSIHKTKDIRINPVRSPPRLRHGGIPIRVGITSNGVNIYFFLFLFTASFFLLNFLAIFDPLVTFNRSLIALKLRLGDFLIFILPVIIIILLNVYKKRFWCFKLCPLGALAELLHRSRKKTKFDINKRKTLIAIGAGVLFGGLIKTINIWHSKISDSLLRPPGSLPENEFTDRCIRCGSCISVCLTGTLTPVIFESGIEGIFTPKLVPVIAECDENCAKCGEVCPTGAIRNLPLELKKNIKIGTAKIDRSKCIAWSQNALCLVCKEFCPYLAISVVKNKDGIPCPAEVPEVCHGCGHCENHCPARPVRAIKVFNSGAGKIILRQCTLL